MKIISAKTIGLGIVVSVALVLALTRWLRPHPVAVVKTAAILLSASDVESVTSGSLDQVLDFTGDLSPTERTIISAEVDARINRVLVDEGQVVAAGQPLAELDTLELAQALTQQQAQLDAARAQLELAKQKVDKQSQLLKQGFVSQIAFDELSTSYQAAVQNYKAQQALFKRSQKQLANTHITAPFAGVIYQKNVEPGQLALKNTKLFALANLARMEIKAAIPSDQINQIHLKQRVYFKVETDNQVYSAQVSRINQVAEAGTRAYLVYIGFDNRQAHLKAGQFVKGQIVLKSLQQQVLVGCDAVRTSVNQQAYVLLVQADSVRQMPVQVLLANRQRGLCAVSGIQAGARAIVGNVVAVKAGDKVQIID